MKILVGFKEFIARGNVLDLAVGFVMGAAFTVLVESLVTDLLTPVVAAIFGQPDFSALSFTINGSRFRYGSFLNAVIAFFSVAVAIYFFVVAPMNALKARREADAEATVKECPHCLSEIPAKATRCPQCTSGL